MLKSTLGILTKCMDSNKAQTLLIHAGLISWLLATLQRIGGREDSSVEEMLLLLMSLSLRSEGRRACQDSSCDVLSVLRPLLDSDNVQIRTYVNGTLYSILASPTIRRKAKVSSQVATA